MIITLGSYRHLRKEFKACFIKEFLENKDTEWGSILPKIIEQDNNTPHTTWDNIIPNQAISDPTKRERVMHLNILKAQENGIVTDLKPGDKVRVDDTERGLPLTQGHAGVKIAFIREREHY